MLNQSAVLDQVFAALSDPSRRSMVERLGRGSASVGELAEPLDMTLAGVVQHLQVLEDCGLVRTVKKGRVRTCRLSPGPLGAAERWIASRRAFWSAGLAALDRHLRERKP